MELSEKAKKARRLYMEQWREANREKQREYMRKWREKNAAKVKQADIEYWERKGKELLGE